MELDEIDLSSVDFWTRPWEERDAAFQTLRERRPLPFFQDPPDLPDWLPKGPGYYAVTKHADILEISRQPDVFCSSRGATSVVDMPTEMLEFFGSMINLDDPRHARLRRIVSRGFTPKMLKQVEDDV